MTGAARRSLRLISLAVVLSSLALVSAACGGSGGVKPGAKPANVPAEVKTGPVPMTQEEWEAAIDAFLESPLRPQGKTIVFAKSSDLFPTDSDAKSVGQVADSSGWMWAAGAQFTAPGITSGQVHGLEFDTPEGASAVGKAWEKYALMGFSTVKPNSFSGQLTNGTPYSGFTVTLYGGDQNVFMLAPQNELLMEMNLVGDPKSASEKNAAAWMSKLAETADESAM